MRWIRSLPIALLAALLQLGGVAHAQRCAVPLAAVGPIDPADGFPQYYLDSNDLPLAECLDFVCDPALPVPDPTKPVSFPDNFPDEFFYQRAIADMTGPNGEAFLLNLALEGSFLNGVPVNGEQIAYRDGERLRHELLPGRGPGATRGRRADRPVQHPDRPTGPDLRERRHRPRRAVRPGADQWRARELLHRELRLRPRRDHLQRWEPLRRVRYLRRGQHRLPRHRLHDRAV
jgi:hypothetical protein